MKSSCVLVTLVATATLVLVGSSVSSSRRTIRLSVVRPSIRGLQAHPAETTELVTQHSNWKTAADSLAHKVQDAMSHGSYA